MNAEPRRETMEPAAGEAGARGDGAAAGPVELTVLLPCLDEAETLAACIRAARCALGGHAIDGEILLADNGSRDGSVELARAEGARVVCATERGYGSALRAGIAAARGRYVIMADADGSYDLGHIPRFLERLRQGDQLVVGNRFAGGIRPGAMPWLHRYVGNPVLSGIGQLLFRCPVRDFHCGLRGFSKLAIQQLGLRACGMEFASEMVIRAAQAGLRISELPTTLSPDGRSRRPHLRPLRDGLRHLRLMLRLYGG